MLSYDKIFDFISSKNEYDIIKINDLISLDSLCCEKRTKWEYIKDANYYNQNENVGVIYLQTINYRKPLINITKFKKEGNILFLFKYLQLYDVMKDHKNEEFINYLIKYENYCLINNIIDDFSLIILDDIYHERFFKLYSFDCNDINNLDGYKFLITGKIIFNIFDYTKNIKKAALYDTKIKKDSLKKNTNIVHNSNGDFYICSSKKESKINIRLLENLIFYVETITPESIECVKSFLQKLTECFIDIVYLNNEIYFVPKYFKKLVNYNFYFISLKKGNINTLISSNEINQNYCFYDVDKKLLISTIKCFDTGIKKNKTQYIYSNDVLLSSFDKLYLYKSYGIFFESPCLSINYKPPIIFI